VQSQKTVIAKKIHSIRRRRNWQLRAETETQPLIQFPTRSEGSRLRSIFHLVSSSAIVRNYSKDNTHARAAVVLNLRSLSSFCAQKQQKMLKHVIQYR
jgi:hypothetical protein